LTHQVDAYGSYAFVHAGSQRKEAEEKKNAKPLVEYLGLGENLTLLAALDSTNGPVFTIIVAAAGVDIIDAKARRGKGNSLITNWFIPKLELLQSVASNIRLNGVAIQWSADITENAHIHVAKNLSGAVKSGVRCACWVTGEEKPRLTLGRVGVSGDAVWVN
jgi:hypothetical protein